MRECDSAGHGCEVGRVFAAKGEKIVEMNQKAFDIGLNAVKNW